jgi:hypothetical protein
MGGAVHLSDLRGGHHRLHRQRIIALIEGR